jgi:hypothetical protein
MLLTSAHHRGTNVAQNVAELMVVAIERKLRSWYAICSRGGVTSADN